MIGLVYALLVADKAFLCDDAFISLRYAQHLAGGQGLRFNVGEEPPVEGFSNLLWVLWGAAGEAVGNGPAFVVAGGVACGVALVLLTGWGLADAVGLGRRGAAVASLSAALAPGLVVWGTGGLETAAMALTFGLLAWAWIARADDEAVGRGFFVAVALMLVRTEGIAWVGVIAALGLGTRWWEGRPVRRLLGVFVAIAALAVMYAGWRWSYFGDVVSNVARAKVGFSQERAWTGASYVLGFWLACVAMPAQLLAGRALVVRSGVRGAALGALAAGVMLYAVLVGGDFMAMGRLLVPAVPLLALAAGAAAEAGTGWAVVMAAVAAVGAAPLYNAHVVPAAVRAGFKVRDNTETFRSEYAQWRYMAENAKRWRQLGRALRAVAEPGDSLVVGAVGAVGYETDLWIWDRYGLVTPEVAGRDGHREQASPGHEKEVPIRFFVSRRPTFLKAQLVQPGVDLSALTLRWATSTRTVQAWGVHVDEVLVDGAPRELLTLRRRDTLPDTDPGWIAAPMRAGEASP